MKLKDNYDNLLRDIAEEDLDNLANARSFSVSSVAKSTSSDHIRSQEQALKAFEKDMYLDQLDDEPPTTLEKIHKLRVISRQDSIKSSKSNASSSSGCPSERSSSGTPTTDHLVFETDFPMGMNFNLQYSYDRISAYKIKYKIFKISVYFEVIMLIIVTFLHLNSVFILWKMIVM